MHALGAERATRARLAAAVGTELLAGRTFVAAFGTGGRLRGARGLAEAAQIAAEGALVRLVEAVAARPT